MKPMSLSVPSDCEVYNFLYRTSDPEYLTQDQLTVALPNGFYVDVTWAPQHDPDGEYFIRVFYEYWNNQRLPTPITTRNVDDVVSIVQSLVQHFNQEQIPTSSSGSQHAEYALEPV